MMTMTFPCGARGRGRSCGCSATGVVAVAAVALALLATVAAADAINFPHYMQCDSRWGKNQMGVKGPGEQSTICGEGCAMTSLSMALAGYGIHLPGQDLTPVNPATLNAFLQAHSLYTCAASDCNNLVLNAVEAFTNRLTFVAEGLPQTRTEVARGLQANEYIYLAHVRNGTHFVLLTGYLGGDAFSVLDPFYNASQYDFSTFKDMIIYKVLPESSSPPTFTPKEFVLFKQCNSSWGNELIESQTICAVGCLLSSVSMGLRGYNVLLDKVNASNPGTLNYWLQRNKGYDSGNDLIEEALNNIEKGHTFWPSDGMHTSNDLDPYLIRSYMLQGRVVILHVMDGHHFVLATGWSYNDDDVIFVNDPGFDNTKYSHSNDVVGYRIFDFGRDWPDNGAQAE